MKIKLKPWSWLRIFSFSITLYLMIMMWATLIYTLIFDFKNIYPEGFLFLVVLCIFSTILFHATISSKNFRCMEVAKKVMMYKELKTIVEEAEFREPLRLRDKRRAKHRNYLLFSDSLVVIGYKNLNNPLCIPKNLIKGVFIHEPNPKKQKIYDIYFGINGFHPTGNKFYKSSFFIEDIKKIENVLKEEFPSDEELIYISEEDIKKNSVI